MSEEAEVTPPEEGAEKKKKKGGTLMAVVAAVIMAAGGAFAGITFLGNPVGEILAASAQEDGSDGDAEGEGQDGAGGDLEVHVIDQLVVNPAGSGATRFLLASVAIAPGPDADPEVLTARDIEIRDGLLMLLGSKSVDELADIQLRNALTDEIVQVLTGILGEGWVDRVFLPQFVIQ